MSRKKRLVRDVMSRPPITVSRNDTLQVTEDLMKKHRIRHVLVLDSDQALCGVVSRTDLFRGALLKSLRFGSRAEERLLERLVVKEAMSEPPVTVTTSTSLAEAGRIMIERQIGCLPVLENDDLAGILTETDFVRLGSGEAR